MGKNFIKVIWEDSVENFSTARERELRKYLAEKYATEKINIIYKTIGNSKNVDVAAENISGDLIINTEYQHKLMKAYLKERGLDLNWAYLAKLDATVNTAIEDGDAMAQRFKKFSIKKIEFSNFLSFSPEKHKFNISDNHGILTVESIPANYGGKTIFTVDLLLFLFFNVTTRTKTAEEIFNLYSNADEVMVRGELEIDGSNYIIERTVKRAKKRDGSYNVTTSLDFYQIFEGSNIIKLNGEQRAATDQIIKNYIGTKDDFLLTIVTTSKNLEDLIDSKPTERGQILTRFIGIDFFRDKESVAKQNYQDWLLKTKIKTHTPEGVLAENKECETNIEDLDRQIAIGESELEDIIEELGKKTKEKEENLRFYLEVDKELYKVDEERVIDDLAALDVRIKDKEGTIEEEKNNLSEPTEKFDIDEYKTIKAELAEEKDVERDLIAKLTKLSSFMSDLSTFSECSMCGKTVINDETTKAIKKNQEETKETQVSLDKSRELIKNYEATVAKLEVIRENWSVYDKAALLVERSEMDLQRLVASKERGNEVLTSYRNNKKIIDQNKIIETTISKLDIQITNLDNDKLSKSLLIGAWKQDKIAMTNKINENTAIIDTLHKELNFQKHFLAYIDMFGKNGIGKMVLATMIPLINSYLTQILSEVSEFKLELDLNDKNMVEFNMIDESEGVSKPLYAGSGFEKTVASIALRCALSKICSLPKPNIIVFDEVFGKVSNDNLEKMSNLFERLKEFFDIIILISHNPIVHEWGDNKLVVVKTNNMSRLMQGKDV